jgi:hypothetical protein
MPDHDAARDAATERAELAYRAIGRYIVGFSELIWAMRTMVETYLNGPSAGEDPNAEPRFGAPVELLLGEAGARHISDVFFALCREISDLDDAELAVANALHKKVNQAIEERNDIAHGDWVVYFPGTEPWISRVRPSRKSGARKHQDYPPERLEEVTDGLRALTHLVAFFGEISLNLSMLIRDDATLEFRDRLPGELRVRDVLAKKEDGTVSKDGPKALWLDDQFYAF